jgi:hypothetical protein
MDNEPSKELKTSTHDEPEADVDRRGSIADTAKGTWDRLWPVIACGAGLFSDGYLNGVRASPDFPSLLIEILRSDRN